MKHPQAKDASSFQKLEKAGTTPPRATRKSVTKTPRKTDTGWASKTVRELSVVLGH